MANTIIQIKRSTTTTAPASLSVAEQAYSYLSDKLFIGNTAGTGVIEIGGKYWVDTTQASYNQANTARNQANAAFETANTAASAANTSLIAAYDQANAAYTQANVALGQANASYTQANVALGQANTARTQANAAYLTANAAFDQANGAYTQANVAFGQANAAYNFANTRFSANGGTISGDVNITGNLHVAGNVTTFSANNLIVNDPIILLANNNTGDVNDIGVVGHYDTNSHTGIFRSAATKEWYVFSQYDEHFFYNGSGNIDLAGNNFTLAVLNADIRTNNLILNGVNAAGWITASYNQANAAYTQANVALGQANAAYTQANLVFGQANAAYTQANLVFGQANTARNQANVAYLTANAAFDQANAAYLAANIANTNAANASFLSTGTVPSARVSGSYANITGVGTLTAGTWNADTIKVPYGGTGMVSFTTNGILYGNAAGDLKVTGAGTEGQVLQASSTGVPQFGMLDGGTF